MTPATRRPMLVAIGSPGRPPHGKSTAPLTLQGRVRAAAGLYRRGAFGPHRAQRVRYFPVTGAWRALAGRAAAWPAPFALTRASSVAPDRGNDTARAARGRPGICAGHGTGALEAGRQGRGARRGDGAIGCERSGDIRLDRCRALECAGDVRARGGGAPDERSASRVRRARLPVEHRARAQRPALPRTVRRAQHGTDRRARGCGHRRGSRVGSFHRRSATAHRRPRHGCGIRPSGSRGEHLDQPGGGRGQRHRRRPEWLCRRCARLRFLQPRRRSAR